MNAIRFVNKVIDRKYFTLQKYEEWLKLMKALDFVILPLRDFENYYNDSKVVIGLRHDIDSNIEAAMDMFWVEDKNNIRSSYYVLHSADYYNDDIIQPLKKLQNAGFEVGLHNNCESYARPEIRMKNELKRLRFHGLKITGTSAHGDKAHKNQYFWRSRNKADFGIDYEAIEQDFNKYYSDCTFTNYHRWKPSDTSWASMKAGDRIQLLIHPETWGNKLYL